MPTLPAIVRSYEPLAEEVARQSANAASLAALGDLRAPEIGALDTSALDWAAHVMQERTDESRRLTLFPAKHFRRRSGERQEHDRQDRDVGHDGRTSPRPARCRAAGIPHR